MQHQLLSLACFCSTKKQHLRYISVENSTKITSTTITTTKIVQQPSHLQQFMTFFQLAEIYQNPKSPISTKRYRQKNPDTPEKSFRVVEPGARYFCLESQMHSRPSANCRKVYNQKAWSKCFKLESKAQYYRNQNPEKHPNKSLE